MVKATGMMRRMAVTGTNFYQFPIQDHIILWITAALFLLVGIIIFRVFEKRAMVKGTLGQY
jgi:ABC-2 type transport system permease protein